MEQRVGIYRDDDVSGLFWSGLHWWQDCRPPPGCNWFLVVSLCKIWLYFSMGTLIPKFMSCALFVQVFFVKILALAFLRLVQLELWMWHWPWCMGQDFGSERRKDYDCRLWFFDSWHCMPLVPTWLFSKENVGLLWCPNFIWLHILLLTCSIKLPRVIGCRTHCHWQIRCKKISSAGQAVLVEELTSDLCTAVSSWEHSSYISIA